MSLNTELSEVKKGNMPEKNHLDRAQRAYQVFVSLEAVNLVAPGLI